MARFRFRASDQNGQPVVGDLQAESLDAARRELATRNWQVHELELEPDPSGVASSAGASPAGRVSNSEAVILAEQLANITGAGLPLPAGLRALADEAPTRRMRRWLVSIAELQERGESLSAVARHESVGAWPRYFLSMLQAGQQSGRLPEVLDQCVVHLRATAELRRQFWFGMAYPVALIMAFWILVSFVMSYVVPNFKSIFLGFGTELPGMTVLLINFSDVTHVFNWWSMPAALLGSWLIWQVCPLIGLARQRDRWFSRIPFLGEARRNRSLAEFFRLLSLLAQAQVTLPDAIRLAADSLNDVDLREACLELARLVSAGRSLATAAEQTGRFPEDVLHLFDWADQGDNFVEGLRNAGDVLAAQSRLLTHTFSVACEPTVTVIIGLSGGFTVLALFMPLVKLLNDLS